MSWSKVLANEAEYRRIAGQNADGLCSRLSYAYRQGVITHGEYLVLERDVAALLSSKGSKGGYARCFPRPWLIYDVEQRRVIYDESGQIARVEWMREQAAKEDQINDDQTS